MNKIIITIFIIVLFMGITQAYYSSSSTAAIVASQNAQREAMAEQERQDAIILASTSDSYDVANEYNCGRTSSCIIDANLDFSKVKKQYNCTSIDSCKTKGWNRNKNNNENIIDHLVKVLVAGLIILTLFGIISFFSS